MPLIVLTVLLLSLCTGVQGSDCDQPLFQTQLQVCLAQFSSSLELTDYRTDCVWPHVKGSYNVLKHCVDDWANISWCSGVGSFTDDFFLEVHRTYFSECGRVQDPPLTTFVLMVAPLVIFTVLLSLLCTHLTTEQP